MIRFFSKGHSLLNGGQMQKYLFAFNFSLKKSVEQRHYYDSRLAVLNSHNYPHFKATITLKKFH